ncbi:unnamed protein product [Staurois parvus]|uniref:Uncharacterized protein n=1 Tax=Staurois parvus TaxID=386267 RepID=A0ABN9DTS2_9NEOB|nr:unnamed protein product [Staurois parvus]
MKSMEVVLLRNLMRRHQNGQQIHMHRPKQLQKALCCLSGKDTSFQLLLPEVAMSMDHTSIQKKLYPSLFLCCNVTENAASMEVGDRPGVFCMPLML